MKSQLAQQDPHEDAGLPQESAPTSVTAAIGEPVPENVSPEVVGNRLMQPIHQFVGWVRNVMPAAIVNNGIAFNSVIKGAADGLSVWSSVRKGSASPARLAAAMVTLSSEFLGSIYSEKDIPEEKKQEYATMGWPRYMLAKTKEAFDPKNHILETIGLATIVNGIFTTISGINQSSKGHHSMERWQGVLTTVAGLFMSYVPNRERAWQLAMGTFWLRAPVGYKQAHDAYFKGNPEKNIAKGDWQQMAKWWLNQTANLCGFLFVGVKKQPDGSIIHIGKKGEEVTPPYRPHHKVRHADGREEIVADTVEPNAASGPATQVSQAQAMERLATVNAPQLPASGMAG